MRITGEVLDAQPDLRRLDSAHLDRLTVLRSREAGAGILAGRGVPAPGAAVLAGLRPQQREAWVFARVYGLGLRDAACAMDCSLTALQRHLDLADEAFARALGTRGAAESAELWRRYSLGLAVPEFFRLARRRRVRRRKLFALLSIAILLGAVAMLVLVSLSS
jgi:hypothetical protein